MIKHIFLKPTVYFFICYFILLFLYLLYINLYYLEGIPHIPDSVAYLFMAKIFASGHLILPIPANPDHFRFFDGTLLVSGGMWLFQYPFGHPLLLAIGILFGIPNAVPPLVSTLTIFELVIIVSILYSRKTIFFLLPLPFISPFFIENSASFMSHTTAAFYLITSILCIILALEKHTYSLFFISGVCMGLLFNTRPLTALPFFVCALLLTYIKQKNTKERIPSLLSFLIGFGVLFLLWMVYNSYTTSSPFTSEYFEVNKGIFGFGQRATVYQFISERLNNVQILAKNFFPVLYNLPQSITVLLLTGFLFFRRKISWDILFFTSLFLLPITYFFYNGVFLMYGPRFWYEITPFAFILTARTLELSYEKFKKSTLIFMSFLIMISLMRLYSIIPVTNPDFFTPLSLNNLKGFNFVDNRIVQEIQKQKIHNSIVFVQDCSGNWWCYGSVFSQNSPFLDTDVIYVKDLEEENYKIFNKFPNRSYYKYNYDTYQLTKIM